MKKRIAAAVMTSVMAGMMMVTPTFAANTGSARTDFSLYVANDPVYTVIVPETVTLNAKEHTLVPITASDVKNIPEGKKITVTLQKGNGTYGRLYLVGDKMNGAKPYMMTLNIKGTSGDFKQGALEKQIKGMELVAFTEDGTENYEIYPCAQDYPDREGKEGDNLAIQKGVHYTGWMDYGVGLTDIK